MIRLESYTEGRWTSGKGEGRTFVNPTNGETLGTIDSTGLDAAAAVAFARTHGLPALQALSFAERGALLNAVADTLIANRAAYGEIARLNSGNTLRDAAIDIDGGIGTLKFYARLGKQMGSVHRLIEPGQDQLTKADTFLSRHIWTSRPGVAIHVNAFNFPSWGLWEKVAVSLLAGVPVVAKPASGTAWLSEAMVRDVIAANLLPSGALSLICGAAEGLLDAAGPFDGIAFTGSSSTGMMIRSNANVLARNPRVTIEADSVNLAVLTEGAAEGGEAFGLMLREVTAALSTKAGQLCTNIRRILVPRAHLKAFAEAASVAIDGLTIGDPALENVKTGPLVDERQRQAALEGLARLTREAKPLRGGGIPTHVAGADAQKGAFLSPTLLLAEDATSLKEVHAVEVFGPVATLIPYDSFDQAIALAARGEGSLAASVYADDPVEAARYVAALAPFHGRVLSVDPIVGKGHTGHSIVMPQCVHGGPGRAGGGEELGSLRGLRFWMQRSAIQGSPDLLSALAADASEVAL
jgi:3,4-dehydroadipyl-CoA semialdehyde dehydrogenase